MSRPENEDEKRLRELRELEGKNIAHYSVLLGAWIETRMERDRTLVTLSAAAIGLLVTILTAVGVEAIWEKLLFASALISFLVTIFCSLKIYQLNSNHIESAIRGSPEKDPRLKKYDNRSFWAFIIGVVITLLIGIMSATCQSNKPKEKIMSEQQPSQNKSSENSNSNRKKYCASLDGLIDLNPQIIQNQQQSKENTTPPENNKKSTIEDTNNK